MLSRLIGNFTVPEEDYIIACAELENDINAILEFSIQNLPLDFNTIKEATKDDAIMQNIIQYVVNQWPEKENLTEAEKNFYNRRENLSISQNCLMFANRLVIPKFHRRKVLESLHQGHPGISSMKSIARNFVYWPNIDKEIEIFVKQCSPCQSTAKSPTKTLLHSWPIPEAQWKRVHADFAGPFINKFFLITVDSYSKWPEVLILTTMTSSATVDKLIECCSRFGNFKTLVTDNGTTFTSELFKKICKGRGIEHLGQHLIILLRMDKQRDLWTHSNVH
jgi:hypothetical protein